MLPPPPDLSGEALTKWLAVKPESVAIVRDGNTVTLTGEALARGAWGRRPCRRP